MSIIHISTLFLKLALYYIYTMRGAELHHCRKYCRAFEILMIFLLSLILHAVKGWLIGVMYVRRVFCNI